jgi:hypothetical protein
MRKAPILLVIAAFFAVGTHPVQGQVTIKGGVSHARVSSTGAFPADLGSRTGFALGLALTSEPSLLGFGVEALYAQRGGGPSGEVDGRDLDYIDVPAYVRVMLPAPGLAPFAYAGPQVSFEVRCREGNADCTDFDRRTTTYAGVIGAGVQLGSGSRLSVEGRYVYGLQDLHLDTVTESGNYRNRSFMILVGVSF